MGADERFLKSVQVTRGTLERVLNDPRSLIQMTAWDVKPEDLEVTIRQILDYLDRSRKEAAPGGH